MANITECPAMTAAKAAEIAAALERCKKELSRIANLLPTGHGDNRTRDFSIAVGCVAANAKMWSDVMWNVSASMKK